MNSSLLSSYAESQKAAIIPNGMVPDDVMRVGFDGLEGYGDAVETRHIFIVDKRALERECLARGLREHNDRLDITTVGSLQEMHAQTNAMAHTTAVLVVLGNRQIKDPAANEEISQLVVEMVGVPVIVLADADDPATILAALECGVHGYIPTSVSIRVAAEAIALAEAGGVFVPANAILALSKVIHANSDGLQSMNGMFTMREAHVVEALRRGKANKIIAYELNLCESTVKVHIRNIMKKLKATNRTEVAYKLRDMTN